MPEGCKLVMKRKNNNVIYNVPKRKKKCHLHNFYYLIIINFTLFSHAHIILPIYAIYKMMYESDGHHGTYYLKRIK